MIAALLEFICHAVFTLAAVAFTRFARSYWRRPRRGSAIGRLVTLICGAAALLAAAFFFLYDPVFDYAPELLAGVLPPLMLHLAIKHERIHPSAWRGIPAGRYYSGLTTKDDAQWT
jgi:hypothetical protein